MNDSPRGPLAYWMLLRPHQWAKNAFVLAPLLFAREWMHREALGHALVAFAAFSLAASGIYALNDILDAARDRLHPRKRFRPVAAGAISASAAGALAALLVASALALALQIPGDLAKVIAVYIALNILYSVILKRFALIDAMVIAVSFVLRVLAGAAAIEVVATRWLLLCTLLLALFLAFSKRRAELAVLESQGAEHRPALAGYSTSLLDRFDAILSAATIVAYALYCVAPETVAKFGTDRLIYGLPFVIYGLFRYMMLIERGGDAGEPGRLALGDPPMLACLASWVALNVAILWNS